MKTRISIVSAIVALAAAAFNVVQLSPADGKSFTPGLDGRLAAVEVFAPTNGSVSLKRVWSADVYTNAVEISQTTSTVYTVVYSNAYTHVVSTNSYTTLSWIYDPGIISQATNETVTAVTNTWPVFKELVAVTNTICDGTASSNIFTNSPSGVFLRRDDFLIFDGTATGGFLRLILE